MEEIILAGGVRTPFGDFGKSLRDVPLQDLGVHAVKASLARAGIAGEKVDSLNFGNVTPVDKEAAIVSRVIAVKAGLPVESNAMGVNRGCASGLQSIVSSAQDIRTGGARISVAAGGENFSRIPYVARGMRWGNTKGHVTLEDGADVIYRCGFSGELMGETAENVADRFGYTREEMDEWGLMSQQRAQAAIESGFLAQQIEPIEVPEGRGTRMLEQDEFPRFGITAEKLAALRPVFRREGGRVTPGSSSGVTDGAAAIVVASRSAAEEAGIAPDARLLGWTVVGVPPEIMGIGPVPATQKLLERFGLSVDDIDYFEINEAFAPVNLHAERELGIPREKTNLYGGGISLGHPPGATGLRMTMTAIDHLKKTGGRYAVITMCIGGGQGMAGLIENIHS
ncbi:thiolase family protein [Chachezhania sediminis]|uniref:thiolase family protein n=1 Tax=Chachezhania sediminis TaxID=2599291 RepID=UPI00131DC96C|nr:thiolase family protein [Chachezhania sediminis]